MDIKTMIRTELDGADEFAKSKAADMRADYAEQMLKLAWLRGYSACSDGKVGKRMNSHLFCSGLALGFGVACMIPMIVQGIAMGVTYLWP